MKEQEKFEDDELKVVARMTGLSKNTVQGNSAESLEYSPSPKKDGRSTVESKETPSKKDVDKETVEFIVSPILIE